MSGSVSCFILATTMIFCTYIAAILLAGIIIHMPEVSCQIVVQDIVSSNSTECSPSCLMLSEYIDKVMSSQIAFAENTFLVLKSGNHFLTSLLTIKNLTSFSILTQTESTVVTCSNHSAGFRFANVTTVKLVNITLSGCGSIHSRSAVFELHYIGNATIQQCNITSSKGLVIHANNTSINIVATSVKNSSCDQGVALFEESTVVIEDSLFLSNTANNFGVVYTLNDSELVITRSKFENNSVAQTGIIQLLLRSEGTFVNITIIENKCQFGILHIFESSLECHGNIIVSRNVGSLNTVYVARSTVNFTSELSYLYNHGTILVINSKATFTKSCKFSNNVATKRGGALTAIQSSIHFNGRALFHNNSADYGGAVILLKVTLSSRVEYTYKTI